jgi:hypothetical protein
MALIAARSRTIVNIPNTPRQAASPLEVLGQAVHEAIAIALLR